MNAIQGYRGFLIFEINFKYYVYRQGPFYEVVGSEVSSIIYVLEGAIIEKRVECVDSNNLLNQPVDLKLITQT